MRHRLEQRFHHDVAEADAEERRRAGGVEVEERVGGAFSRAGAQGVLEVAEGDVAVGIGLEGDGPGGLDAGGPVVGQQEGRMLRRGVDAVGARLLVVVGRGDARRPGGAAEGGRVPEGGEAVEEGGHVVVGEVEGVVGRQAVGTQQNQLVLAHALDLAEGEGKSQV